MMSSPSSIDPSFVEAVQDDAATTPVPPARVDQRLSRLSATSMLVAVATAPWVTLPLLGLLPVWVLVALPCLPIALGILAVRHIAATHPRRRGLTVAMAAIALGVVWVGSACLFVAIGLHEGWARN
jgi:hypothetical protein